MNVLKQLLYDIKMPPSFCPCEPYEQTNSPKRAIFRRIQAQIDFVGIITDFLRRMAYSHANELFADTVRCQFVFKIPP